MKPLKPFRLAAVDLDGTLLDHDGNLPPRNAAAARAMVDAGIVVVLASGRMHASMLPSHDALGLDTPIVSYNGAMVLDPGTREMYHHRPLGADVAVEVVRWAEEEGRHLNYYIDDCLYVDRQTEWSDLYARRTGSIIQPVGSLSRFDGRPPTKIIYVGPPELTSEAREMWSDRLGNRAGLVPTMPEYLEFLNPLADKWSGVMAVAGRYGIEGPDVAAFGDSPNDGPMLEGAGTAVVMPHARPEVRAMADVIVDGPVEEAFALAVEALLEGRAPRLRRAGAYTS